MGKLLRNKIYGKITIFAREESLFINGFVRKIESF